MVITELQLLNALLNAVLLTGSIVLVGVKIIQALKKK
jgi:hypothetical protein